jgi:hypothetical protein
MGNSTSKKECKYAFVSVTPRSLSKSTNKNLRAVHPDPDLVASLSRKKTLVKFGNN